MAAIMADESNGRVTLALVGQKIDRMADDVTDIKRQLDEWERRLREVEREQTRAQSERQTLSGDVDTLETRVNGWGVINSIGAAVAAAIAFFVPGR